MATGTRRLGRLTGGARGSNAIAIALARAQLTVTGGVVLLVCVVAWFLARALGARALFLLVYLGVLAVIVSWVVTRRRPALVVDRSDIALRMREGQPATVTLTVRAERRVTTVVVEESLSRELGPTVQVPIASLSTSSEHAHRYTFTPTRRGVYRIGPTAAVWSDPFGLTVHRVDLAGAVEVIVHPATEPVHDRVLARMWEDPPIRPPVSKPWPTGFEFYGMRDYVPGDDLRRVVWSAVAKTDRMLVRESEQGITDRVSIIIDTDREWHSPGDPSDTFETAIKAAASLGAHHLGEGFSVSLLAGGNRLATRLRGGAASRIALLDELARLELNRYPLRDAGADMLTEARRGSHLVILTPHLDREVAGTLRLALERGSSVTVAALVWDESDPQLLARAAAIGCEVVQIPAGSSLEAVFAHQILGAGVRA
jgi:uncharacterized protein (DUF58 family)